MLERDLERLLRDATPAPDADTAHRLDTRVEAARGGAGPSRRAGARPGRSGLRAWMAAARWRPAVGALCAMVLAAVLVVSAVRSANDGSSDSASSSSGAAAPTVLSAPESAGDSGAASTAGPAGPAGRKVQRSAAIRIGVARVEEGADEAMAVADRMGGLVMSTDIRTGADEPRPSAELVLRVPTAQLGRALAALSRLGEVRERTQSSTDITAHFNAADAQLAELRAERRSLLAELGRAQDADARATVRRRLELNRVRLQAAAGNRQRIDRAARLARIDVTIEAGDGASGSASAHERWGLDDAVGDAGRILSVASAALVLAGAVLLPATLLAFLLAVATRRLRRRWREHALDGA